MHRPITAHLLPWHLPRECKMKNFTLSLDRGQKYLLGFSGGADSVCLFHLLRTQGYSFSAAHVNHGIRGDEADRDEQFCRALADRYGIEFHVLRVNVPAIANESGESLEEAARKVRYSFFGEIMREGSIDVLLTAHNADDNAETLLLSLARGCSPSGACGIAPVRRLDFGEVRRPILSLSKKEIFEFCHENSFDFVTDSTNSDISYPRNRIRQNILPELDAINPQFLAAIARFTETQREDCIYLDSLAEQYAENLDCAALRSLPRPIASRALALAAYRSGASPEGRHIEKMLEMAKGDLSSLSLPGGVIAFCEGGRISFRRECREPKKEASIYPVYEPVALGIGENRLPQGKLILVSGELTNDYAQVYNLSTSAIINLDRIKGRLCARPRREGDRILIGGIHKSVKKLISEKLSALPLKMRRSLPVVCDGDEIVWIPGLEASDHYRGTNLTVYYIMEATK